MGPGGGAHTDAERGVVGAGGEGGPVLLDQFRGRHPPRDGERDHVASTAFPGGSDPRGTSSGGARGRGEARCPEGGVHSAALTETSFRNH